MNVMIDLETLGTRPGSIILSVGAVEFGLMGTHREFYVEINQISSMLRGMTEDESTRLWWSEQGDVAGELLKRTEGYGGISVDVALREFAAWLPKDPLIWGNGAAFDNTLLAEAYLRCGQKMPWSYRDDRCYRTLRKLTEAAAIADLEFVGTLHHALDDARHQATHAVKILRHLGRAGI
jgi:hypothetical protein